MGNFSGKKHWLSPSPIWLSGMNLSGMFQLKPGGWNLTRMICSHIDKKILVGRRKFFRRSHSDVKVSGIYYARKKQMLEWVTSVWEYENEWIKCYLCWGIYNVLRSMVVPKKSDSGHAAGTWPMSGHDHDLMNMGRRKCPLILGGHGSWSTNLVLSILTCKG